MPVLGIICRRGQRIMTAGPNLMPNQGQLGGTRVMQGANPETAGLAVPK